LFVTYLRAPLREHGPQELDHRVDGFGLVRVYELVLEEGGIDLDGVVEDRG
jgi:hypothetical protein